MPVREKIKQARKDSGLSQQSLGDIIGVKGSAISKYESGSLSVSIEVLRSIAVATRKPVMWFIREVEAPPPTLLESIEIARNQLDRIEAHLLDVASSSTSDDPVPFEVESGGRNHFEAKELRAKEFEGGASSGGDDLPKSS